VDVVRIDLEVVYLLVECFVLLFPVSSWMLRVSISRRSSPRRSRDANGIGLVDSRTRTGKRVAGSAGVASATGPKARGDIELGEVMNRPKSGCGART